MRRTGKPKSCVWRSHFMEAGYNSHLHDKIRPFRIQSLGSNITECIAFTQTDPPAEAIDLRHDGECRRHQREAHPTHLARARAWI